MTDRLVSTLLDGLDGSYRAFSKEDRVDYLPEHPGTIFVSAKEARGQVEDCI